MLSDVSHFLLTSFSVRHASLDQTRIDGRALGGLPSEAWIRERINLFERYCLPSVVRQEDQDFVWMVYISTENPGWLKQYFASLRIPNLKVEEIEGTLYGPELVAPIRRLSEKGRILTTRLDNDDALAEDFVTRLRQALTPEASIYSFVNGIQLMPWGVTRQRLLRNPFLSLLEDVNEPNSAVQTILQVRHDLSWGQASVHEIGGRPGWMQVVHGSNLGNQPSGWPCRTNSVRSIFPIPASTPDLNLASYFQEVKPVRRVVRKCLRPLLR